MSVSELVGSMRNLIRISDYTKKDIARVFQIADDIKKGKFIDFLKGKAVILFFPETSIRTRITFVGYDFKKS